MLEPPIDRKVDVYVTLLLEVGMTLLVLWRWGVWGIHPQSLFE